MKFEVIIETKYGSILGRWINSRKQFVASSINAVVAKVEKDLLKSGLHRDGDYHILDIRRL